MSQSDFDVIRRVLNGETAAFELLVRRHERTIFSLAQRMTRNAEEAKDIAQEAFVQAYRSLSRFHQQSSFSTWLYRIAVNLCLNHLKASRRADPLEVDGNLPAGRSLVPAAASGPIGGGGRGAALGDRVAAHAAPAAIRSGTGDHRGGGIPFHRTEFGGLGAV